MAYGQDQGGGLFARPDVESIGLATWAQMAGVHPDSPLVGGRGTPTGGVDPDYKYRRVALTAAPDPTHAAMTPPHARELLNFSGSPMPWLLLAAIAYLGLVQLHLSGSAGIGRHK